MDPTERFTSRVEDYVRYRPGYPPEALALLAAQCGLQAGAVVADVGSGTGILTERLLASGARVFAVEPNARMRAAAEALLGTHPRFASVAGTAEATTLPPASVDLLVAAQAFHWFDTARARTEALRIVRPGGCAAFLWNEHPPPGDAFVEAYDALLRRHAAEYAAVTARRADEAAMRAFLGGTLHAAAFANEQRLDFAGLRGRVLSSSYAPEPGHPQYEPLMAGLRVLYAEHERGGTVVMRYRTLVYYGTLAGTPGGTVGRPGAAG